MKVFLLIAGLIAVPTAVWAECYTPKTARDAIRAVALISDRSMITDMVGGGVTNIIENQNRFHIWANYRNHGYSDKYEVIVEQRSCRVISLQLLERDLPIQEGD